MKVGTNADDSAPSANKSRVRLGMRKPNIKASYAWPAPNIRAMMPSRTKPLMRLMKTASDATPALRNDSFLSRSGRGCHGRAFACVDLGPQQGCRDRNQWTDCSACRVVVRRRTSRKSARWS